jgi:hypothetical protein
MYLNACILPNEAYYSSNPETWLDIVGFNDLLKGMIGQVLSRPERTPVTDPMRSEAGK